MKKILKNKSFIKYLISGGSAFLIDYLVLNILFYLLKLPLVFSATAGYFAGFAISFLANRYWVFGADGSERKPVKQMIEYIALVVINYGFTVAALRLLEDAGIEPWLGKILTMICIVVWNYFLFKKVIFSNKSKS